MKSNFSVQTFTDASDTFEPSNSLYHRIEWRRFDSFVEEFCDITETKQLDGQGKLMERGTEDLRLRVSVQPEGDNNNNKTLKTTISCLE